MKMPGNKNFSIEYADSVVDEDIPALPEPYKSLIKKSIEDRLAVDPVAFGKPLRYSLTGYRRLRMGDYRIIYKVEPRKKVVLIVAIKHRKDIYQDF